MADIHPFTLYKLTDVPEALRMLAHQIEHGDGGLTTTRCVVVLETAEGAVDYRAFGTDYTQAHAAGLLHAAAIKILT